MSTTMKDLFDDDSSSDDEAAPQNNPLPPPPNEQVTSPGPRRVIQEEEDDDSSSDEPTSTKPVAETKESTAEEEKETESAASVEKPSEDTAPTTENTGASTSNDDEGAPKKTLEDNDDDDEDVEFNDDGVVGSSAPAVRKDAPESEETATTAKRQAKKPRHLQVLESQRPPDGTTLHITKLPNLVGIQTEPFDLDTYSASIEELERGNVHSTMIRWRYAKDDNGEYKRDENGQLVRESNTRLVAWDDGNGGPKSYTLHVGAEVFEVDTNDSSSNGFAGLNGYLYLSQKATLPDEDHTPAGTVLESMGAIKSRFVSRPSSLQSEAHKKLTVAVRQKTIKKARIAEYVTQEDPERAKQDRIKVKADLEKASARKRQSSGYRRPAMSRRYLEEEEDGNYDSVNIRAMKRGAFDEDMDYGEDSDEEEEEDDTMFNRRKPTGSNKRAASRQRQQQQQEEEDDDEEDELMFEEESDEDEIKATSRKKLQHQALVDDDDDE